MKRFYKKTMLLAVMFTFLSCGIAFANSPPVVSNVYVPPPRTDGSGIVDIYYTLSDADNDRCTVSIDVSNDGGSSWTVTATSLSGDIGGNISPGNRHIIWNSKTDLPGAFGTNYRFKITADDNFEPSGMVWVYINDPGVPTHEPFNGQMSKYETTNAQYCQFLNTALASGDVVVDGTYVKGANGSNSGADFVGQNYYYLAGPGSTYDGATNGGAARINWTGSSFTVDSGFENHPVTYVSWYGSTAFASYYGWRLPTEWEWQAVADYNGSYTYGHGAGAINNSLANYYGSLHPYGTTAVGSYGTIHDYGMCDMAGNVWELTSTTFPGSYGIIRGGSWYFNVSDCEVSVREYCSSPITRSYLGFRVCR